MAFNEAVEVSMQLLQQVVVIHVNSLDDIVRYKAFLSRTYAFLIGSLYFILVLRTMNASVQHLLAFPVSSSR
jgi:hypothetical protein